MNSVEWTDVEKIHSQMTFHAMRASITEASWKAVMNPNVTPEAMKWLYTELLKLKETEWTEVHQIYTYTNTTPEMWENYEFLFDTPVLDEHKQMVQALRLFKKAWKKLREGYRKNVSRKSAEEAKAGGHDSGQHQEVSGGEGLEG